MCRPLEADVRPHLRYRVCNFLICGNISAAMSLFALAFQCLSYLPKTRPLCSSALDVARMPGLMSRYPIPVILQNVRGSLLSACERFATRIDIFWFPLCAMAHDICNICSVKLSTN